MTNSTPISGTGTGKPIASLSLDLDNLWAYQMTHGDAGWDTYPSYLDVLVPRVLEMLAARNLRITFFVVGQDAALEKNAEAIAALSAAGHEIANHSFRHQPWLHRYTIDEIHDEFARTEEALEAVTGQHPRGFRGPGYSLSADVLRALVDRGYRYDCSTLPTVVGPLARWYYFRSAKLSAEQRAERSMLFGGAREGLRPLKPYQWAVGNERLLEIPVTTMPLARVPMHVSYVLYLAGPSPTLAHQYFANALRLCRVRKVAPSILLHPLDFLGADDVDALGFFPGMSMTGAAKRAVAGRCLDELARQFDVVTMVDHAEHALAGGGLSVVPSGRATPVLERSR
jgi:peptidoglycan/xylan/chitin deacetylase (PgdA/CDA1 family)